MRKNILLIELPPQKKALIGKHLGGHFEVVKTELARFEKALAESAPELVMVRIAEESPNSDAIMHSLEKISAASNVPVVVMSPLDDASFYMKCLKAGVAYHIKTPGTRNYLISKLSGLLRKRFTVPASEEGCGLAFSLDGVSYDVSVTREQLITFLLSTIENSRHQSRLVQEIMKKKYPMVNFSGDPDILESPGALSPEEAVMADDLARSYERGDFRLFFQPVISLADEKLTGFEALIRWEHPEKGIVPPDEFIPVLEKTPLIGPLGFWIVEEAARQIRKWDDEFSFSPPIRVNVNLSARQFVLDELCERIFRIVEEYRVPPESLAFEITESAFMEDMESANLMLLKLKAGKHRIYMDDFGTGYSSLSYLQHFPVDTLKIDKSFVEWMHIDEQSEQIVRAIIDLAHNLKMTVVAEGVEVDEHRDVLKRYGCDYGQGYYFSKPLDVPAARQYLRKMRASKLV